MNVLVLNCGSSSLKFQLRALPRGARRSAEARLLAHGKVQGIGAHAEAEAEVTLHAGEAPAAVSSQRVPDYAAAVRVALDWIVAQGTALESVEAVGHRFVHGGTALHVPARIDDDVRAALHELEALAPLHNRPALAGVDAAAAVLGPQVPQVAVFDTAFHHPLPEVAQTYGLPWALAERHGIRRFGFHGTSCRSVVEQYGGLPEARAEDRLIVLHLGSGCSATAVRGGQPADTSMGFTPLEGLLMGTRCGDLDPALPAFLARREGLSGEAMEAVLNGESGLQGVSGVSNDLRDLLAQEGTDARVRLAVELFCYRVRKYVGAYLAVLEGAEAVLFTGGVGEYLPEIRARICGPLDWSGLRLDAHRNEAAAARGPSGPVAVSAADAAIRVYVIPSDEERLIAWDTVCLLG